MQPVPGFWVYPILGECTAVQFVARSCSTLAPTVASMFGVGASGSPAHAAVAITTTADSKTITLLNRVAIAGYYTHAVRRLWWRFWRCRSQNIFHEKVFDRLPTEGAGHNLRCHHCWWCNLVFLCRITTETHSRDTSSNLLHSCREKNISVSLVGLIILFGSATPGSGFSFRRTHS